MTKRATTPKQTGRARAAKVASWVLGTSLVGAAAAGPALAEAKVQRQLRERLGVDDRFAVDFDLGGLELRGLSRALPGNRGRVSAERVRIRPGFDGLKIEIDGLEGSLARRSPGPKRPKSGAATKAPSKRAAEPSVPKQEHDPIADVLVRLRGIPIEVVTRGRLEVELTDGVRATARDPQLELPGDGRLLGRASFDIGSDLNPSWARAKLELAAKDTSPRELQIRGSVDLDGDGRRLTITGQASRERSSLQLHEPHGGEASVEVERNAEPGRDRLTLDADALPLDLLEPLAQLFGRRLADALGERDGRIVLDQARMSGTVELLRGAGLTHARFDGVELTQITVDTELLAPHPVLLEQLSIDGELAREHTPTGPHSFGELVLGHAGVTMRIAGELDADALDIDVELDRKSVV